MPVAVTPMASSQPVRHRSRRPSPPDPSSRSRLLHAAVEIFERKGYAAASVREIVEHAGVTKPALYYHFRSKEGILIAALELALGEFETILGAVIQSAGGARTRLTRLCVRVMDTTRSKSSLVRVAHAVYFGPREAVPPFDFQVFDRLLREGLRLIIEDGVAAGEIRRAAAGDAVSAVASVMMLGVDQHANGQPDALDHADVRRLINLVFDGISAPLRSGKGSSSS
jgi:TetR/AcrR family transcriptional regulator